MKTVLALLLVLTAFAPPAAAQTASSFTGKWEGTFTLQNPDGTANPPRPITFNLTQKGKQLSGTAGPPDQQSAIDENAAVKAGKATFEVHLPNGSLFRFALTIVKGHLTGDMIGERDGVVRGHATVDAAKGK